jgi:hypothetical protein
MKALIILIKSGLISLCLLDQTSGEIRMNDYSILNIEDQRQPLACNPPVLSECYAKCAKVPPNGRCQCQRVCCQQYGCGEPCPQCP